MVELMSYCGFDDDSDVYLYEHIDGFFECCSCRLQKFEKSSAMHKSKKMTNLHEVLVHLMKHKKKGYKVPNYAFKRALDEINGQV